MITTPVEQRPAWLLLSAGALRVEMVMGQEQQPVVAAHGLRLRACSALLTNVVPAGANRGRTSGFERTTDDLGSTVGPLLALALVAVFSVRLRRCLHGHRPRRASVGSVVVISPPSTAWASAMHGRLGDWRALIRCCGGSRCGAG